MIDMNAPLDLGDPEASAFLSDLQGNVLKPHARDHAAHVFVRFRAAPAQARAWLAEFARKHVTSAGAQAQQAEQFRKTGDGGTFGGVAISAAGYAALGVTSPPADARFRAGMKQSLDLKGSDPPPSTWEPAYQGDLHVLAVFADQDCKRLAHAVKAVSETLHGLGDVLVVESGDRLTRTDPRAGELTLVHFGFADGISQPLAIKQEIDEEYSKRGRSRWDPAAPLSLLLAADPGGGFGSYFVFRKLEQNVAGFLAAEAALVDKLGLAANPKRVEPMIVGRYRDGYPPLPAKAEPSGAAGNDFNFDDDRFGAACPYHAHIRKTNPRGDLASAGAGRPPIPLATEKRFRIARRGIAYGPGDYLTGAAPPPTGGVGLLFMSAQSDLQNFEIQQAGSDSNDFATVGVGVDATIGHSAAPAPQSWITPTDVPSTASDPEIRFTMANFVTLRGGEYFFLPSLRFLTNLDRA